MKCMHMGKRGAGICRIARPHALPGPRLCPNTVQDCTPGPCRPLKHGCMDEWVDVRHLELAKVWVGKGKTLEEAPRDQTPVPSSG